jgi:ribose/xylose/arabinose/galactoside ABC-type transport system permease subunit
MPLLVAAGFTLHPDFARVFWTREYLPNILQQAATNIILATGLTFVILTGGIDLSVGSVMALCGVTLGLFVKGGPPTWLAGLVAVPAALLAATLAAGGAAGIARVARSGAALLVVLGGGAALVAAGARGGVRLEGAILACLMAGLACGLINGLFVALGKVPAFIVTLGALTAARGLTLHATNGNSVAGLPERLGALGQGWALVLIALAVVASAALLQARFAPGRRMVAVGGGAEAARLSGIDLVSTTTLAYALSGLAAAVAAVVLTAKFRLADTNAGAGAELNAIAAVVIGGTSLSGGRGSVIGSLCGALTIAILNAGLVLIGVQDTLQGVVIGAVIVLAVMLDRLRSHAS